MVALTAPGSLQVPSTSLAIGQESPTHGFTDFTNFKSSVFQITTQTSMPVFAGSKTSDSESTTSTDDLSAAVVDPTDLDDHHSGPLEAYDDIPWPKSTPVFDPWSATEIGSWQPHPQSDGIGFIDPALLSLWAPCADVTSEAMPFTEPDDVLAAPPCVFGGDACALPTRFCDVWLGGSQQRVDWGEFGHQTDMYQKPWARSPPPLPEFVQSYPRPLAPPPGLETTAGTALDTGASSFRQAAKSAVSRNFQKTRLCSFFVAGRCDRDDQCLYAHGPGELREVPDLTKTRLCPSFASGGKCRDAGCRFAHSAGELRGTNGVYKTQLCRWWRKGRCKAGPTCRYAHGEGELQHIAGAICGDD